MAAVTQLSSNFLGGVSRQPDDKKQENQLVDIVNGYSDPTYGLVKRGGTRFLWNLTNADGDAFEEGDLDDAFWFYAESTTIVQAANAAEYPGRQVGDRILHPYICCIHEDDIHMWDSLDGDYVSVTNNGRAYLRRGTDPQSYYDADDFHYRSILDTVIICNKHKITAMDDDGGTFNAKRVGTVRINNVVPNTDYTVRIDSTNYTYNSGAEPSASSILEGLRAAITSSGWTTKQALKTSLELARNSSFTLSVRDSGTNSYMNSYQDTVSTIEELANPSANNRLVRVTGLPNDTGDDYYLRYSTASDTWEEARDPEANSGINASTMPHRLFINTGGNWEFGPIPWADRLVGSEDNSPDPSFIGKPVNASFYYNNRLGLLSESNVIMSRAKSVYDFFPESQLTTLESDPIDLNCNSTRPVELVDVVPQPAGVVLFAGREQFYMSAPETGVLTPTATVIKGICNYECAYTIPPLEIGTNIAFVSKMPDYTRLMLMEAQGLQADPKVVEISKVITGWMPGNVSMMAVSPQNSFVILASRDTNDMYLYRYYNDGQEDKMQAWQRWDLPGNIQACNIVNDLMFVVTEQGNRYCTSVISINELTSTTSRIAGDGIISSSPSLDMLTQPFRADNTDVVTYDATTGRTRIYVGFPVLESLTPVAILTLPARRAAPIVPGRLSEFKASSLIELVVPFNENIINNNNNTPSSVTDASPGYYQESFMESDANGNYMEVEGDWTQYWQANNRAIAVGYKFDYEVTLPKLYFRLAAKNMAPDYTASLTIQRVKFSIGRTGAVTFKLRAFGREEWIDIQPVTNADYYEADTPPVVEDKVFTLPINQRNKHFQLKVTSDMPFPVSLISMMWEGNYSPRFYRRV